MKKEILIVAATAVLLISLVAAQGQIINLQFTQEMSDFIAGETMTFNFSFNYPDISATYPNQADSAMLAIVVNISSNDTNYPVWKGDFELDGEMWLPGKHYEFECVEDEFEMDYFYGPVLITDIPDGVFYCSNKEFLAMNLDSDVGVSMNVKSNPALWPGKYNFTIGLFYPEQYIFPPPNLTIYFPENEIYGERRIKFNITTDQEVESIEYIRWSSRRPRWRRLCRNCNEYGYLREKMKSFSEGNHGLSFKTTNYEKEITIKNISIFVDTKKPRISKMRPRQNKFTNGSNFYIRYSENNLKEISVNWNSSLSLPDCNSSGRNQECYIDLNLSDYDGEKIEYWFNVSDFVRSVASRKIRVKVDTTAPVIDDFNFTVDGRRVEFVLNVSEDNLDEIIYSYIDNKGRLRERRLCSRLRDGICKKKKSFRRGIYNLTITTIDRAGNGETVAAEFEIL